MLPRIIKNFFGTSNERIIKSLKPIIDKINGFEDELIKLSDEELAANTVLFKERLKNGETLDDILPHAFATIREAAKRVLGERHYDVQLIGGIILHRGMIAEMKTGEGKTLSSTLPIYLNALSEKGVHVVTVNDYLARRDSEWMGRVYKFLGLTVGCITNNITEEQRKNAYNADITYGTNNEFGFDYLRDNLKYDLSSMVQREFNFAIVDEVDSILIDEARTPLIISGATEDNSDLYIKINHIVPSLNNEDLEIDEKTRSATLTDVGNEHIEELLKTNNIINKDTALYEFENMTVIHHVNQALKAHKLFKKDVDYIIKDNKVMIIDEFTGRIMDGRRYSEGLHQALEAKEDVHIQNENQTLASITFQNYFRMYPKLAGMTGTALTEAQEFADIYKLEVVSIPTHIPVTRKDENDEIYLSAREKYEAIVNEIEKVHATGQPLLVGTANIERSEFLSDLLDKKKIKHNVLNARFHEQEAQIISQAGRPNTVTIATNMAGRGTDIKLGGNFEMLFNESVNENSDKEKLTLKLREQVEQDKQKVYSLGGLCVLSTERHESRRIDNQLRGRAGRQGDPGRTKFFLSLEDDLMRIFGSEKIKGLLTKLGIKEGESITHPWISRSIEKAQQKVEARNYDVRKNLLKFDDVMNDQRKIIYDQRKFFMNSDDLKAFIDETVEDLIPNMISQFIPANSMPEEWETESLTNELFKLFNVKKDIKAYVAENNCTEKEIFEFIDQDVKQLVDAKFAQYDIQTITSAIKQLLLLTLDQLWKEHLHILDHLRTGIGLRAYGQKDPLNEYKFEAYNLFKTLMEDFALLAIERFSHLEITHELKEISEINKNNKIFETRMDPALEGSHLQNNVNPKVGPGFTKINSLERDPNDPTTWGKVSRNEECPCGSGKKYKYCHGMI